MTRLARLAVTAKAAAYYSGLILADRVEDRRARRVTIWDRVADWWEPRHAARVRQNRPQDAPEATLPAARPQTALPDVPARPEAFLECFYAHDGSCMCRDHAHPPGGHAGGFWPQHAAQRGGEA